MVILLIQFQGPKHETKLATTPSWTPRPPGYRQHAPPWPYAPPHPHRHVENLRSPNAPSIRIGSVPTVIVSSPEMAHEFLRVHDADFANRPPSEVFTCVSYGLKGFAFVESGPYWRDIRKLCVTHLLSAPKIASFRSVREEEVSLFVNSLSEAANERKAVNISTALGSVTSDIACRMVMGRRCMNGDDEGTRFREMTNELMSILGTFNVNDFIPMIGLFDFQKMRKRMMAVHRALDAFLEKIIDEHSVDGMRKEEDFVNVLLSFMHKSKEEIGMHFDRATVKAILLNTSFSSTFLHQGFAESLLHQRRGAFGIYGLRSTLDRLGPDCLVVIISRSLALMGSQDMLEASMDPLRTLIEWALTELLRHPQAMTKVQDELAAVVGLHRPVEDSDLAKLKYLGMVVKETLRLHPLSAFLFHHGKEETVVAGFRIPKGSSVMVNIWAIGRDEKVWPDADEFMPERFEKNDVDLRGQDFRLLSFGSGRRICAGMQLALVVVPLLLAQMVHCFDWELPEGMTPSELDMSLTYGFTMPRANHLWAIPTKRLHA